MKILLLHPGHSFSTSDVFDGLLAGFQAAGADVVTFQWDYIIQRLGTLVMGATAAGFIPQDKQEQYQAFISYIAANDVTNVAIDHDVDAVFVVNGTLFPASRLKPLKKLGIAVACYGTEAPYFEETERQIAPMYDYWFTQERSALPVFRSCTNAFYLPMAYNPEIHIPGPIEPDKQSDVVFIGGGYPERRKLLDGVDWSGIDHQRYGTLWHLDLTAEKQAAGLDRAVRYAEGSIPNLETMARHRSAAISLNIHRTMTHVESTVTIPSGLAESLGPRAYEIPAVGGFMLCDDERPELRDVFGDSAATFRAWDSADLERQVTYWLAHPDERERMAQAQHQAVQPHTWTARARTVLETLTA